ncbi:MAG: DUF4234 domain-containing protein, partial [Eubacteriales bacterium]|nr:DUF4234 domain-containing protein [Eubacteriales bacterium]
METRRVDQDRKLWKYIIFSALTCGIYGLYFMYTLVKDLNTACGYKETDEDKMSPNYIIVVLLTCVTCGIYAYYWWYKQGNRIKTAGREYGINIEDNGSTYLLWFLVGVLLCGFGPLIGMHIFLKNLNLVCKAYNDETQGGADQYAANFNSSTDYQNNYSQNNNNQWDAPAQNKSN